MSRVLPGDPKVCPEWLSNPARNGEKVLPFWLCLSIPESVLAVLKSRRSGPAYKPTVPC
jgi:hypothetical protein